MKEIHCIEYLLGRTILSSLQDPQGFFPRLSFAVDVRKSTAAFL